MSALATRKLYSNTMFRPLLSLVVGFLLAGAVSAQTAEEPPPTSSPSSNNPPIEKPAVPVDPAAKYRIEKGLAMFDGIRDDAIFPWTTIAPRDLQDVPGDQMEERAYDEVLRHARQFTSAELEQHARRDIGLKDLFTAGRKAHKLELFYFEGRLKRLVRSSPTEILKASGITDVYEAWVFPKNEIEAMCVLVTELPTGLTPPQIHGEDMDRWVGIAGYSFKLMRYESQQFSRTQKGEHVIRRAPVLMGRSLTLLDEPESASLAWRQTFMPIIVGGAALVAFVLLGLSWYYRKTDAVVREAIEKKLDQNPFANG